MAALVYLAVGVILFAGYETWGLYRKLLYGFVFPVHWIVGNGLVVMIRNANIARDTVHEYLFIALVILCIWLAIFG